MKTSSLNTLRKIRQSNATWLCTVRRAPFWVFPKKLAPYRLFLLMVLNQETELILKTDTSTAQPSPDDILKNLFKAMQGSLLTLGHSSRPANILIDDAELVQVIAPQLAELGIRCRYRDSLPKMRAVLLEMEETINKRKPIPGLLSIAGASVPLVAELYTAAADYNNIKPWRWIENWQPIEIRFPPEGRARFCFGAG